MNARARAMSFIFGGFGVGTVVANWAGPDDKDDY
jgi:hypothetical protein